MSRRRSSLSLLAPALLELCLLSGCSGDSGNVICGGLSMPSELHIADLTPALGATVANDAIVHAFTVTDDVGFSDYVVAYTAAHTAGDPTPAFSFSVDANNTYTADAVTWQNAPAHVELEMATVYQTPDGCAYRLPSPLFAYDLTEP